jgi:DNA topoisomerase III
VLHVQSNEWRQMETQMRAICAGTTTRHDVIQRNLEQFRQVYSLTIQQLNVLKTVSNHWWLSSLIRYR